MANISSAFGDMTFETKTQEDLIWLVRIVKERLEQYGYNTYIDLTDISLEDACQFDGDVWKIIVPFTGTGRWSYSCNIKYFGPWFKEDCPQDILERLTTMNFSIVFDYCDEESGCMLLYAAIDKITHHAGEDIALLSPEEIANTDYAYTKEHLILLGFYDDPDDIDWID
jgi:hypothetical protein